MERRGRLTVAAALAVSFVARTVAAEPCATQPATTPCPVPADPPPAGFWHVVVPWTLVTPEGTHLQFPPAFIFNEAKYSALDTEMKRLQDAETRLTAENAALKKDVEGWQPGWYTLGAAALAGIALGWYAHDKL